MTFVCKKDTAEQAEQSRAFDKKLYRVRQAHWFNCVEQYAAGEELQAAQWRKS